VRDHQHRQCELRRVRQDLLGRDVLQRRQLHLIRA
jgi:hypothetical protein